MMARSRSAVFDWLTRDQGGVVAVVRSSSPRLASQGKKRLDREVGNQNGEETGTLE